MISFARASRWLWSIPGPPSIWPVTVHLSSPRSIVPAHQVGWRDSISAGLLGWLVLLVAVASTQVRDIRAFFLAVAFMCISGIFLAHALTTPTALIPYNSPWVGFSAYFSLFLGGIFLALSTLNWPAGLEKQIVNRQQFLFA